LLVAAGLVLSGCASSGPTGQDVLTGGVAPKKSRLVMYRTSPLGMAVQPNYTVDGKPVGQTMPNGFVVCHLDPGPHQVAIDNLPLNVNLTGGSDKASVTLRPGQTTYLRADVQVGLTVGVITLSAVTEDQGRTDVASLHKLESACT
jgi:hypothetical protein